MNYKLLKPLPHQQRVIDWNPNKAILNHEMRVGKSLPACHWVDNPCRSKNSYIITLKSNKQEWIDYGTNATVITKEEFKKLMLSGSIINPTAVVFDEAHKGAGKLFVKKRSQLAVDFYNLVKEYPECHILLLSATVVTNSPYSLHTLLCFVGIYIDWKEWRGMFFELKMKPFLRFPTWMPKDNWRKLMKPMEIKYTDIIALKDVVKDLPPAETRIIDIKQKKYEKPTDEVVTWTHEHQHEQEGKIKEILELGYKKIIVVCRYTDQINELAKELSKYKPVFILNGHTKDQDKTIKEAQDSEECYFIVQSKCGEGWDGYMFSCMVFVSMDHSNSAHTQMLGRQRHPKHLKVTETIYINGGRWDRRIYKCVMEGRMFNPHVYAS